MGYIKQVLRNRHETAWFVSYRMSNKRLKVRQFRLRTTSWRDSGDKNNPCVDSFGSTLCRSDDCNRSVVTKRWRSCRTRVACRSSEPCRYVRGWARFADRVPISTATTLSLQLSRNGRAEPKPKRLRRL